MRTSFYCLLLLSIPLPALGQAAHGAEASSEPNASDDADERARAEFLVGEEEFAAGAYVSALRSFRSAYELSARPELLYNIGHTCQLLGRRDDALQAYRQYLEALPEAENRPSVESRMDTLIQQSAAPQNPSARGPGAGPWILMGSGVALAIAGTVFLALAGSAASNVDDAANGTPWTQLSSDYDRSRTFGAVGAVGLGLGAALLVSGGIWRLVSGRREGEARAGRVEVELYLTGAGARVAF